VEAGSHALQDLLEWMELASLREQSAKAKDLVAKYLHYWCPVARIASWNQLAGEVAVCRRQLVPTVSGSWSSATGGPAPGANINLKAGGRQLVIFRVNFNAPNARDSMRLPSLCAALATACQQAGPEHAIVCITLATRNKMESTEDPLDDEVTLREALTKAGFGCQKRFRMILKPPAQAQDTTWDFYQDGRVACYYNSLAAARGTKDTEEPNAFIMAAELCRTGVVQGPTELTRASEFHKTSESDDRVPTPEARSAQRGCASELAILRGLLNQQSGPGVEGIHTWVSAMDTVDMVDLHPCVGDCAEAVVIAQLSRTFPCALRLVLVDHQYKVSAEWAPYTLLRVGRKLGQLYATRAFPLYEFTKGNGGVTATAVQAAPATFTPDPEQLKQIPGCLEAYQGLAKLQLKVCMLNGNKLPIRPEIIAEFQSAPADIVAEVRALEEKHGNETANKLEHMAASQVAVDSTQDADPRDIVTATAAAAPEDKFNLETFESVEKLKEITDVKAEARAQKLPGVLMLRDDKKAVYLVATLDDCTVAKHTLLGSYGGGRVREAAATDTNAVIICKFADGDRTPVIAGTAAEEGDDGDGKVVSLYKVVKSLQRGNGDSISLAGFGSLQPMTGGPAGGHGYQFEFPEGHEKHKQMVFVPKEEQQAGKLSSGNFFKPFVWRQGFTGELATVWKLAHRPVHAKLVLQKPFVMTTKEIKLEKGKPVKVGQLGPEM